MVAGFELATSRSRDNRFDRLSGCAKRRGLDDVHRQLRFWRELQTSRRKRQRKTGKTNLSIDQVGSHVNNGGFTCLDVTKWFWGPCTQVVLVNFSLIACVCAPFNHLVMSKQVWNQVNLPLNHSPMVFFYFGAHNLISCYVGQAVNKCTRVSYVSVMSLKSLHLIYKELSTVVSWSLRDNCRHTSLPMSGSSTFSLPAVDRYSL